MRFLLVVVLLASSPAPAQNLLTNGGFDTDLSGWRHDSLLGSFSSEDASGSPTSGSILLRNPVTFAGGAEAAIQCVAVSAGKRYSIGGRFLTTAGGAPGSALVQLLFYPSSACGPEGALAFAATPRFTETGAWTAIALSGLVAPAGATHAQLAAVNTKDVATGVRETRFDDLFLVEESRATRTLPALASIHGRNETFFQTDLWLLGASARRALPLTFRYHCYQTQTCPSAGREIVLAPRGQRLLENVVGDFLSAPETAGALELSWDASIGDLAVSSRIYTPPLPAASFGAAIPALPAADARTRSLLLALAHSGGDATTGFRTNAGAYNPGPSPSSVTLTLHGADGGPLGTPVTREWAAGEAYQVNDVFAAAGAGGVVTRGAYLVVTSSAPVFSYATVVDNRSGDSVFVTAGPDAP